MKHWLTVFFSRFVRVLTLDRKVFTEIYADPRATLQSFILVLLATFTAEIGRYGFRSIQGLEFLGLLLYGAISWVVFAGLAFIVSRFILPMPGTGLTPPSVARAITFAHAPLLLMIFGLIPGLSSALLLISGLWFLVAITVALKNAFAWSLSRAIFGMLLITFLHAIIMWRVGIFLWEFVETSSYIPMNVA